MLKQSSKTLIVSILLFGTVACSSQFEQVQAQTQAQTQTQTQSNQTLAFPDIDGLWNGAADAIKKAVEGKYVEGYPDGTFKPNNSVSRAEFVKMAVTAMKLPVTGTTSGSEWYKPYAEAAAKKGILRDTDFSSGDWNTPISRFEMARISVRSTDQTFQDKAAQIDDKSIMYNAAKTGLIQGLAYGELAPDKSTTRAQSVTIVDRILTVNSGGKLEVDKYATNNAEIAWHGTNIFTMLPRYFDSKDISKFDINKFKWDSSDGIYHEEVVEYIVVDMEDPNDPHRTVIEGLPFFFAHWDAGGKFIPSESYVAPKNSYVTFSKVKQVIKGQYPKSLFVADGGKLTMEMIVPQDAIRDGNKNWRSYTQQENPGLIKVSKETGGRASVEWNINQGNNPFYLKNIPSTGGTFYWVEGQIHPKGDFYSFGGSTMNLHYMPNIAYYTSFGPKLSADSDNIDFRTNYNVSNP